ncbi:MAG: GTP 3',8-cyclase MoaA [Acidobacteriota bacterium]|nr:GTP 3',8-cyclase MoaA [Acidobacteriota bacterium]
MPRLRLLRLSVTDLCNFRCRYCMPAAGVPKLPHSGLLPLESLERMVKWLILHAGIERVRLTGGEPLVRQGIDRLIASLASFPGIREVSLTTNASLLERKAFALKAAGLKRVNISLDSLDNDAFAQITRGGNLERTLAGIDAAVAAGLTPIKLNAVLQRSTWKQEVPRLLDYAATKGFEIRFIELMQMGTEQAWCESEYIPVDEVCRHLGAEVTTLKEQSPAPARSTLVNWHGALVNVGWITPRSHPFCSRCERLRMDARGRLRRCLMDPATFDLQQALETLKDLDADWAFQHYMAGKVAPLSMNSSFAMSQIGG